ncbi:DUF2878 domain-containing protein [Robbsia sp. KACC 23696]|uniref:DUF2878 domain-containing protein n=1 Tax=Robbsia sp. KACC 23696 TaxID=3149231 RepID=UPI00325B0195
MTEFVKHLRQPWIARTLYLIACHIGWFVSILSAAAHMAWIGALFSLGMFAYHLVLAERPREEAILVGIALLGAACWESAIVRGHIIVYATGQFWPGTAPYWILGLWMQLAIQVNVLLAWFKRHLWLAALIGAIAGPLSFRAGVAMGAGRFPDVTLASIVLALGWACLFPALMALGRRWDGMAL